MNKLLVVLILIFASTSVIADWDKVGTNTSFDTYVNIKSIRTTGNIAKMWAIFDYKTPEIFYGDKQYQSSKILHEFDCFNDRLNLLASILYVGPMGSGEMVYSSDQKTSNWTHAVPDTVSANLMNEACGKKESIPKESIRKESVSSDFKSYPINTIYKGITAPLRLDTPEARSFRTRLKEAINQPADFAGEFVLARWGCGMGCVYGAAVSRKTGKVVFLPTTVCCWYGEEDRLQYQLNSSLLIANGSPNEGEEYGQFYYMFNGQEFKLTRVVPIDKQAHISRTNDLAR